MTCRLEMEFFFSRKSEIIAVCHVYVTQSSLNVTRVMSSEQEFRSGLSQFHRRNEVKQGHKVQGTCVNVHSQKRVSGNKPLSNVSKHLLLGLPLKICRAKYLLLQ